MTMLPATIDASEPWDHEVPRSIRVQVITGLTILIVAIGGFGYWAFTAPLAAAVVAPGSFVATGRNKMVQHLEGGIISEINIAEGDEVMKGNPMLRLDETTAQSNQRALFLRRLRLEAIEARLLAEYEAQTKVRFPRLLLDARIDPEVATMIDSQLLSFEVARSRLENDLALITRNIAVLDARAKGYGAQKHSYERQIALLDEERQRKILLLDRGLIIGSELNAVERAVADAEGELGQIEAEIEESLEMKARYEAQKSQTIDTYRQAALDELQSVQIELDTVRERERDAQSILKRIVIEAPVSGTVVSLNYSGPGSVVEAGAIIAEILPTDVPLIIEAMIARTDIDSVKSGQSASVRLTALNQRTTPILEGKVFYISADAILDENGQVAREVYVVRISLPVSELERVSGFIPVPGMPAQVMIQTAERSFAQYLIKPVLDSMQRAFKES
jgi:HlyD family secretion protein